VWKIYCLSTASLPDREAAEQAGLYFPSLFASFFGNEKMKSLAGLRRYQDKAVKLLGYCQVVK
jgi:hypothetical protein